MKSIARGIMFWVLLPISVASVSLAPPAAAQTSPQSLKQRLVGHWQLVSVTANGSMPYGANPEGSMFLDAGGHFSVIVISAGNARSVAYFGTYTVDDAGASMTFHIENSTGGNGANAGGRDLTRLIAFAGNQLIVSDQTPSGAAGSIKVTWTPAN
jgi:hypothetical protein